MALALGIAVAFDLAFGDPVYRLHPVRLMGAALSAIEQALRRAGARGYGGGILLFVLLATLWVGGVSMAVAGATRVHATFGFLLQVFFIYSFLALGDLVKHVWRVERALLAGDVADARRAIAMLVGRDTAPMDAAACRRAALESLSENLTDGYVSPLFWYVVGGLPGLVMFKVVSTMDSMVGYRSERYREFGWCGARLDDLMNFVPARLTWALISVVAAVVPRCSIRKAVLVGLQQHALLPGPNSGWSEAAAAGALQRRLVGPIWMEGRLVTDVWLGDPSDAPAATHDDVVRGVALITASGITAALLAIAASIVITSSLP